MAIAMPKLSTSIPEAAKALSAGKLVAIPTETVYGLAADACNEQAVQSVFALKGRPSHNPLIVHVSGATMARRYARWNPLAERLAAAHWPGALTLVLPKRAGCPIATSVSAGGETIALRAPAHPMAQQLIEQFNGGLAAPSANRSGRISPTWPEHVIQEFLQADLLVLEGGPCAIGLESTVVDCTGDTPVILRPGSIGSDEIKAASLCHQPAKATDRLTCANGEHHIAGEKLKSPGLLTSHYAPTLPLRLEASQAGKGEALLGFGRVGGTHNLSPSGNLAEAAANLFAMLRALDDPACFCAIAVAPIPQTGIGIAINDRLRRAAAAKADKQYPEG